MRKMKTHEKTHQTMWLALKIILILTCIYALLSCKSPTAPTGILHPREFLITEFTKCFCETLKIKGEILVTFWEERRELDCSEKWGEGAKCPIIGQAFPYSNHAEYWGPWVRGETEYEASDVELAYTALHESCHLSGIWSEEAAKLCTDSIFFGDQSCYKVGEAWNPMNSTLIH